MFLILVVAFSVPKMPFGSSLHFLFAKTFGSSFTASVFIIAVEAFLRRPL